MEEESPLNSNQAPSFYENPPNPISSNTERIELTTEQLIAKAIAPVKKQFLLPPPPDPFVRHCSTTDSTNAATDSVVGAADDDASEKKKFVSSSSSLLKEKKSKRQFKRDRLEEQKSALHICAAVAKTGDVNSCQYKNNCRLSHDIEAFKAKKPADLEGKCPFLDIEGPCPYGLGCRYSGTHKDDVSGGSLNGVKKGPEVNGLSKDVQKLLWKDKMLYPKSDATLKLLGLADKTYKKKKITQDDEEAKLTISNESHADGKNGTKLVNESANTAGTSPKSASKEEPSPKVSEVEDEEANLTISNGSLANDANGTKVVNEFAHIAETSPRVSEVEDSLDGTVSNDDDRPSKKAKPVVDGNCCNIEAEKSSTRNVADDMLTETDASLKLHPREKKLIDFRDKLYLAPLTTVGNLPFRRVCKVLGADVTCGEMAMCTNLLQGQASEWALLRRHKSEDMFGVQICGTYADNVARAVELIDRECTVDFIDINMGCPIDIVVNKGAGSALLTKPLRMKHAIEAASRVAGETPITVKVRTGYIQGINRVETFIQDIGRWGASALTIHGRSRQQRYSKLADWDYIGKCAKQAPKDLQVLGNGDVYSYLDWNQHKSDCPELSTCMIARGALVKPWIFTEIKEQRHWDIRSGERLNILKDYVRFGLQHWGSDTKGVETTRHFLLEWLSYTYRYVPVGLLEVIPSQLNWRPPSYFGRDDLETLMASESAADWVRITEMLLGKVPEGFYFAPKHKSKAYDKAENG